VSEDISLNYVDDPAKIWGSGYIQQTVEILNKVTWRDVVLPLTIGGALVALINVALLAALAATDTRPLPTAKWDILLELEEPVDWLILGDSTAATSLRPDLIHDMTGETSLNLGTVGDWAMLNDVWMLEQYVERFGAPEGVIIVHALDTYGRGYPNDAVIAQAKRPPSFYDDYSVPLDAGTGDEIEFYLLNYVPIFSRPDSAKQLFENLADGAEQVSGMNSDGFLELEVDPANVVYDETLFIDYLEEEEEGVFTPSEVNQQAFDVMIALADAYQFPVYLLHGPIYEGLLDEPVYQSYTRQVRAWLSQQAARSDRLVYFETIHAFSAEDMQNIDHLSPESAARFTRMVIPAIISARDPLRFQTPFTG
jgi:hypothetical protein